MNRSTGHTLLTILGTLAIAGAIFSQSPDHGVKIETRYDNVKDKTMVRLATVKLSGDKGRYHSLHMSPSFSYSGRQFQVPSTIDFELQTVVKGKLRVDLYVVFIVDGETIFLSSNRSGIKRPVAGRNWMGERLVFNMPYETLLKIANARTMAIKMDAVMFELGDVQLQALRNFAKHIQSLSVEQARRAGSQ